MYKLITGLFHKSQQYPRSLNHYCMTIVGLYQVIFKIMTRSLFSGKQFSFWPSRSTCYTDVSLFDNVVRDLGKGTYIGFRSYDICQNLSTMVIMVSWMNNYCLNIHQCRKEVLTRLQEHVKIKIVFSS